MRFSSQKLVVLHSLVVAAIGLASCSPQPASSPTRPAGSQGPSGALNVALVSLGTENWIPRMNNPDEAPLWELVQDKVVGKSRADGITPDAKESLAERWELKTSGDNIDLTLYFRKNIPFHKGEGIFKASDFKFTFGQFMREGSLNGNGAELSRMVGGDLKNIEIVDDNTAIIHTKTSMARAEFESANLNFGVMPEAYFNRVGGEDEFRKAPIGTGPYQFVEHRANEYVKFDALDTHWRKVGAYKTITLNKVPDPNTALAQLQTGKIDITGLTPRQLLEIKNNKDLRVERLTNSGEVFVVFGGMVQPTRPAYDPNSPWTGADLLATNPKKVREALTIAVDAKTIVEKLLLGEARQVGLPYLFDVPGAGWYNTSWKPREYNPTRAKQLLTEAGFPNGFSTKVFVYPLPYNPSNGDVMEAVAGYWEAVGIKVERVPAEYRPTVRTRLTERTTAGFAYSYTQPSNYGPYNYLTGGCCFRTDSPLNHWEITRVDQLTDEARLSYDVAKRNGVMKQVGDFIYDNYIGIPIASTNNLWAVRNDKVGKWGPTAGSSTLMDLQYIEKP